MKMASSYIPLAQLVLLSMSYSQELGVHLGVSVLCQIRQLQPQFLLQPDIQIQGHLCHQK
jgi:hypothetical protein